MAYPGIIPIFLVPIDGPFNGMTVVEILEIVLSRLEIDLREGRLQMSPPLVLIVIYVCRIARDATEAENVIVLKKRQLLFWHGFFSDFLYSDPLGFLIITAIKYPRAVSPGPTLDKRPNIDSE